MNPAWGSWGDVILWAVRAECRVIRLDLQYCYFLNLHCFVGGTNPSCSGCCIMECLFTYPTNHDFMLKMNQSKEVPAPVVAIPIRELPGAELEATEDRPTESCHNGELRGPGEGLCAASQSHLQCPSAQCPETEGLASQEANTTDCNSESWLHLLFIFKTGLLWSRLVWNPDS